jgi:hypothetical protein
LTIRTQREEDREEREREGERETTNAEINNLVT